LGLGSLVALGLLCPELMVPRDRPVGVPPSASLASTFANAPAVLAAWTVIAGSWALLAYPAAYIVGYYDWDIAGFWYHAPLLVVSAAIAPALLLGGRMSTQERPLHWLAWTIVAVAVGAVGLMAFTVLTTEVHSQY
jgi:hypothetical protein